MLVDYPSTSFVCIRCGFCCRDSEDHRRRILLTPADVDAITRVTHLATNEYCRLSHASPKPFHATMKKDSGTCIFLDASSTCKIYDLRPIICRCYPFLVEFDGRRVSFLISKKDCPGLGRGAKLPRDFFENLTNEVVSNFKACQKEP